MLVYVDQIRQLVEVLAVKGNTVYGRYVINKGPELQYCEYNIVLGIWKVSDVSLRDEHFYHSFDSIKVVVSVGVDSVIATLTGCGLSILKAIVLGKIDKDQIAQELKARGLSNIPEFKIIRYHSGAYSVEAEGMNSWSEFLYSLDTQAFIDRLNI